ncbi:MAG TPA: ThuA domain-containing protein [Acidobacteriaceae bacterium]|jgi:hypothetical protein
MRRLAVLLLIACAALARAQAPAFRVLAFYSETVEHDHVDFAHQAIAFYTAAAQRDGFQFAATKNWDDLNAANLAKVGLVMWLDDQPHTPQQRAAFEVYMEGGGGWLGFHIAAYNDRDSKWPWFVSFLGGGVFYGNNWPPLPATLNVDNGNHPATQRLPKTFVAPANEWYIWKPSPRLNKDVQVLVTLSTQNYPLGLKDTINGGDVPVVWTNTRYRMLYMNMGHGDRIFTSPVQNRFMEDSVLWIGKSTSRPHPNRP